MIISMGFYRRKQGISIEEFRRLWSEIYGPLYGAHPELARHMRRYVQHQLAPNTDNASRMVPYDGISEAWFDNVECRNRMHEEPLYKERVAPLMAEFLDLEGSDFAAYDTQVYQLGGRPPLT